MRAGNRPLLFTVQWLLYVPPAVTFLSLHFNPLNADLNPTRHLLALVGARHIVYVSRIRVKYASSSKFFIRFSQKNTDYVPKER